MKKLLLGLIIIIIVICLAPVIDGYLFKRLYFQQLVITQHGLQNDPSTKIQVDSYEMGWIKSIANVTITNTRKTNNINQQSTAIHIKSIIHHGPLVLINNKPHLAYAFVETIIYPPEIFKIPSNIKLFFQINSTVSFDGNTWTNHYFIPAISYNAMINWDGLSGDMLIHSTDNELDNITNQATLGKINLKSPVPFLPDVIVDPIMTNSHSTVQPPHTWKGTSNTNTTGLTAKWQDGSIFSINQLNTDMVYDISDTSYNYNSNLTIEAIHLPTSLPVSNLSKINYSFSIRDLNLLSISKVAKSNRTFKDEDLLAIFSETSNAEMKLAMNSELGALMGDANFSFKAKPKTKDEISNNVIAVINLRIAQPLFNKILTSYLAMLTKSTKAVAQSSTDTSNSQISDQTNIIVNKLLQRGYIQKDKNDYVVIFSKNGSNSILNGKAYNDNDLSMILQNIQQDIMQTISPSAPVINMAPTSTTMPGMVQKPQPPIIVTPKIIPATKPVTSSTSNVPKIYHCYWLNDSSATKTWFLLNDVNKASCYAADSCNGGLQQTNSGCYKWADSPDGTPQPWNGGR